MVNAPKPTPQTEGQAQLLRLIESRAQSYRSIGRAVGVDEKLVRKWAGGTTLPNETTRDKLESHIGIGAKAWERFPLGLSKRQSRAQPEPEPEVPVELPADLTGDVDARSVALDLLNYVRGLRASAVARKAPIAELTRLVNLERQCVKDFGALTGELTADQVFDAFRGSEKYIALANVIGDALVPFGVAPFDAVRAALGKWERGEL